MNSTIVPAGVWARFPAIRAYLKGYQLGPVGAETDRPWETSDLPLLRRYAAGERFTHSYSPIGGVEEFPFTASNVTLHLAYLAVVYRWYAIQDALRGAASWEESYAKSVAYHLWSLRANHAWHLRALREFERGERPQKLAMLMFGQDFGPCVGECLALGWRDEAVDLARRVFDAMDLGLFNDAGGDYGRRRTQHFVLRLVADWQGWSARTGPSCAFDEPVFNALIADWREPDPVSIAPVVLAACDRHTHHCRYDNSRGEFYDFGHPFFYRPFEILALYRLRDGLGLANPEVDHVLLRTPLGRLPEVTPLHSDALLAMVLARVRTELPNL